MLFSYDLVGVAVAAGPPVLQVAVALLRHLPRDADTATAVRHPGRELVDAGGLVGARQSPRVVLQYPKSVPKSEG